MAKGSPTAVLESNPSLRSSVRQVQHDAKLASYSWFRRRCYDWLNAWYFDYAIGAVIVVNFVLIVVEADAGANPTCTSGGDVGCAIEILQLLNVGLLVVYMGEAAMRIYVYRWDYFKDPWDLFDFFIVVVGALDLLIVWILRSTMLPGMSMLRLFRVARLVRAAKLLRIFPDLKAMLTGFAHAMGAMLWGFIGIAIMLLMWSVLAVELLNDTNSELDSDEFCRQMFSSVGAASLMFWQTLVAGDSWGVCAIPLIQASPASFIVFAGALVTIQLGFTNLILAVIVERAQEAHERGKADEVAHMAKQRDAAGYRLMEICEEVDTNADGKITMQELMFAYEAHPELRAIFKTLDIDEVDLETVFSLMDVDESGDLSYDELVGCIHKSDQDDIKRQVMMLKLRIENICLRVRQSLEVKLDFIVREIAQPSRGVTQLSENVTQPTEGVTQPSEGITQGRGLTDLQKQLNGLRLQLDMEFASWAEALARRELEFQEALSGRVTEEVPRPAQGEGKSDEEPRKQVSKEQSQRPSTDSETRPQAEAAGKFPKITLDGAEEEQYSL
eukprot:TRINITY_DN10798_c0_g3_i1.p1 TRINITY_DN10798_c0_g3~~TRINITY_DN10798_c0_g3_i1.p1  ORF type:complete len:557 (-),score=110.43 TRINITY_DN10798_c0_g3_i1:23-1693(-)